VASDGTILYQGNRLSAALAFQLVQAGESVPLRIWREGKPQDLSLAVYPYAGDRAVGYQHDSLPRYYVYGGLVFTPLSHDYLRTLGRPAGDSAASELYYELSYRRFESPASARPEPVVLATVLTDAVNANLAIRGRALVDRINGLRIEKLEDVARAFEQNTNDYETIEFMPNHALECLERGPTAKANAAILKTYGIAKDRRL
jgi:hypothetical protein